MDTAATDLRPDIDEKDHAPQGVELNNLALLHMRRLSLALISEKSLSLGQQDLLLAGSRFQTTIMVIRK